MSLANETCVECHGGVDPLNADDAASLQNDVPEWEISEDVSRISRRFLFKNFAESLAFVNQVGELADAQNHHPDILMGWGYAHISLQTHAIGGLHKNDFILAAKIDAL